MWNKFLFRRILTHLVISYILPFPSTMRSTKFVCPPIWWQTWIQWNSKYLSLRTISEIRSKLCQQLAKSTNQSEVRIGKLTIALFGLNGQLNVFRIWTVYGNMWWRPAKFVNILQTVNMINGLMQFALNMALNRSISVGSGCVHFVSARWHSSHAFEWSRYFFKESNSSWTASLDVHPRSQHNDSNASFSRFFDNSHTGVSGI